MKIALIGATGRTGHEVATMARQRGHTVVAVGRSSAKLDGVEADSAVVADATRAEELVPALAGVDAVVVCVGPVPGQSLTVQRDAIAAVLEAMSVAGPKRLSAISASGWVVADDDPLTRYLAKPLLRRVLRDANADFAAMEQAIRTSTTRWTILRPPRLTDSRARGHYRSRRDGNVRWGFQISRADLAAAVLDDLEDSAPANRTISVAN